MKHSPEKAFFFFFNLEILCIKQNHPFFIPVFKRALVPTVSQINPYRTNVENRVSS